MIIEPKVKGFICTTAHPLGCEENVKRQISYVKNAASAVSAAYKPKKALIIGSSTGYGLAARIVASFGFGASTIGVAFERPAAGNRTASAGWYNTAAFEKFSSEDGLYAKSIMGDAFSDEVKQRTIELIQKDLGTVDLVIYSLAAPKRTVKDITYSSVIKPIGADFTSKSINMSTRQVSTVSVPAATETEIEETKKVMGGEDWLWWMDALNKAKVLSENVITVAFSYIGPSVTHQIYRHGTVGMAKEDLEAKAAIINELIADIGGKAYISVNKALVTQASSAIPVVPLYISILYKIMKEKGLHEGCIQQIYRLFADKLYLETPVLDEQHRLRPDDWELRKDVQEQVDDAWIKIDNEHLKDFADIDGYWQEFYHLFGFGYDNVSYSEDVPSSIDIPSIGSL
jgi:enoyl-[acyl-carrier protein] reductase/trans-2-enoyl-CoA reductase (NAD+)